MIKGERGGRKEKRKVKKRENEGRGEGVAARERGIFIVGVPSKKRCYCEGVPSRKMSSRVERREKKGVRVGR